LRHGPAVAVALVGSAFTTGLPASSGVSSPCMCALLCNEVRGTVHGLLGNRTDQVTVPTSLVLTSPLAGGWDGLRMRFGDSTLQWCPPVLLYCHGWSNEPSAASSLVATSFRVGVMAAGSPDWSNSSTRPRDPRTASRRMRVPVRVASSGANPRVRSADPPRRICDWRQCSSRRGPDQESPIDPARGRAHGQTTLRLAGPLQNQPSTLSDGVPERVGGSLLRRRAIDPPSPTRSRNPCLFRQAHPPRTGTAKGWQSAMG